MGANPLHDTNGPFRAEHVRPGDPYELSNGHAILCMPTGGRGSDANAVGAAVLKSDPLVESAGIDTGYSLETGTLRAPDVAVGNVPKEPGWVSGAPPLALEYADTGQDEAELAKKIHQLLKAGTRHIWVVRLSGPRRVEVYEPGCAMRLVRPGEKLEAPGILANLVLVEELYDWKAGQEATLRNLLQRHGYADLDAVKAESKAEGEVLTLQESILEILAARELEVSPEVRAAVTGCDDPATLKRWNRRAVTASSADALLSASGSK